MENVGKRRRVGTGTVCSRILSWNGCDCSNSLRVMSAIRLYELL